AALGAANDKCIGVFLKGNFGQAQQILIEESNPAFERLLAAIGSAKETASRQEKIEIAKTETASRRAETAIFIVAGGIVLGLIAVAVIAVRKITAILSRAVTELRCASEGTSSAAGEISKASQALARSAADQALSLERTSSSSEEVSSMTGKNAEDSRL